MAPVATRIVPPMARNPTWTRDELILALELYKRLGSIGPEHPEAISLSTYLRGLPLATAAGDAATYRNADSVAMKLGNYAAIDPGHPGIGLQRGGRGDADVWDEFAHDPSRLSAVAAAIRGAVADLGSALAQPSDGDDAAPEGRLLFRRHVLRERSPGLIRRKKAAVMAATGKLACEVCSFDFEAQYGPHGRGYAECHHRLPLSVAGPSRTYAKDLAIVCANCHRMLHWGTPWRSLDDVSAMIVEHSGTKGI
jgi:5-methylcytosine-specific restriction protein A